MERESGKRDPKTQNGFFSKLKAAARVMSMFFGGIGFAAISGAMLQKLRDPHSHWGALLDLAPLILSIPDLFSSSKNEKTGSGCLTGLALMGCLTGMYFLRTQPWAPVALGAVFATFFWTRSKSTGRSYMFLSAGSLLAGLLSLQFPWPNEQRCLLTLVGVGVTMSLQGLWIILRYLQGERPAEFAEPAAPAAKSSDREALRFIHLIFGTIEHIQIFSPELEQRIRARYQSEISQLKDLGFDYLFSDGESFSLFRLVMLFPALIVFMMLCKREVMTVHDGTKILNCHPIFAARNRTAYACPGVFGVSFDTAFQDGTILLSKNSGDDNTRGAMIVINCCKGASIADTWARHQERIVALEAEGKRVDRQTSFQFYAEMSHKETAP